MTKDEKLDFLIENQFDISFAGPWYEWRRDIRKAVLLDNEIERQETKEQLLDLMRVRVLAMLELIKEDWEKKHV